MSKTPELIALAGKIAAEHKLEPALVCAVIEHESSWDTFAVRYEPEFMHRYIAPLIGRSAITGTEAYTRSMSFGLMQVMGQVAREEGFDGPFLTALCDPEFGIEYGCRRLGRAMTIAHGGAAEALLSYNGGANPEYPIKVLALVPSYQSPGEVHA